MRVTGVATASPTTTSARALPFRAIETPVVNANDRVSIESFDEYYQRDYRSLLGLAFVWCGSLQPAEDLVHEALTEAHRRWKKIAHYDDPGAWVRRVMVNKSTSRFRRLRSETKALTRLAGRREDQSIEPVARTGEVWAAVRTLPTRQAQAIALFYWEDRSIAEIADILGCGVETARTHLKRGRATLASRLEGHRLEDHGDLA